MESSNSVFPVPLTPVILLQRHPGRALELLPPSLSPTAFQPTTRLPLPAAIDVRRCLLAPHCSGESEISSTGSLCSDSYAGLKTSPSTTCSRRN
jgi:hypothetical protein